jgi:hypothetical protein
MILTTCMAQKAYSMVRLAQTKGRLVFAVVVIAALVGVAGCGSTTADGAGEPASSSSHVLSPREVSQLLRELPYRYTFRDVPLPKGAEAAIAGRAVGAHHTVVNFGIALGRHTSSVPLPRVGIAEVSYYPRGGFVFTDDEIIRKENGEWESGPQFHTAAQWREAGHMTVEMEEKLCLGATGKVCPAV